MSRRPSSPRASRSPGTVTLRLALSWTRWCLRRQQRRLARANRRARLQRELEQAKRDLEWARAGAPQTLLLPEPEEPPTPEQLRASPMLLPEPEVRPSPMAAVTAAMLAQPVPEPLPEPTPEELEPLPPAEQVIAAELGLRLPQT